MVTYAKHLSCYEISLLPLYLSCRIYSIRIRCLDNRRVQGLTTATCQTSCLHSLFGWIPGGRNSVPLVLILGVLICAVRTTKVRRGLSRAARLNMLRSSVSTTIVRRALCRAARLGIFRSCRGGVVGRRVGQCAAVGGRCSRGGGRERAGLRSGAGYWGRGGASLRRDGHGACVNDGVTHARRTIVGPEGTRGT
jgi:hypothetical protein